MGATIEQKFDELKDAFAAIREVNERLQAERDALQVKLNNTGCDLGRVSKERIALQAELSALKAKPPEVEPEYPMVCVDCEDYGTSKELWYVAGYTKHLTEAEARGIKAAYDWMVDMAGEPAEMMMDDVHARRILKGE